MMSSLYNGPGIFFRSYAVLTFITFHLRLKVPKYEIFDLFYFHGFYATKPLLVGDLGD